MNTDEGLNPLERPNATGEVSAAMAPINPNITIVITPISDIPVGMKVHTIIPNNKLQK